MDKIYTCEMKKRAKFLACHRCKTVLPTALLNCCNCYMFGWGNVKEKKNLSAPLNLWCSSWGLWNVPCLLCSRRRNVSNNKNSRFNSFLCGVLAIFLPAVFVISFLINTFVPEELGALVGDGLAVTLYRTSVSTWTTRSCNYIVYRYIRVMHVCTCVFFLRE